MTQHFLVDAARWFWVGLLAAVALVLAALALLTVGLSLPFAAFFGWAAYRLARWPVESAGWSRWIAAPLGLAAGIATIFVMV